MACSGDNIPEKQAAYHYQAYGLNFAMTFPCPALVATSPLEPDVIVKWGRVPRELTAITASGYKFEANNDCVLIKTDYVADILVSWGGEIIVQPKEGAGEQEVRNLLLGWGLGSVLLQRRRLPLHGSAVSIGDAGIIMCAPSGTGKSSLAAALLKRGHKLLDDNMAVVDLLQGFPQVYPGFPEIKLRGEILEALGQPLVKLRPNQPVFQKFSLDVRDYFHPQPQPLRKIYCLTAGGGAQFSLTPLAGGAKFDALMKNIFCLRFMKGSAILASLFQAVRNLAENIPVVQVHLPEQSPRWDDWAGRLAEDFLTQE
jgi:hypothetical protein